MSVNADKALQVRPPIAVYDLETPGGGSQTFEIPGVPNVIGGAAPEGAHTMITNFLSVQADETEGDGNGSPFYIAFGPSTVSAAPSSPSAPGYGPNPVPAPEGCIRVNIGETVRFDMSDLYEKGSGPALVPIEYMAVYTDNTAGLLRVWRSSGR